MSKRRRTKAQKIRAAQHRKQEFARSVASSKSQPAKKATTPPAIDEPTGKNQNFRVRDLRVSLRLLLTLILVQVGLWLIFAQTGLDDKLYKLLSF